MRAPWWWWAELTRRLCLVATGVATRMENLAYGELGFHADRPPPTVTFVENTVNATPQIIAAHVTLTDPDDNFNGGTLTVSGLVAQDTVSIHDQGNGAGPGRRLRRRRELRRRVIGSFAGGAGGTFTVTFNAAATPTGIEAVVEHLTYANSSDTPTATRSLRSSSPTPTARHHRPLAFIEQTGAHQSVRRRRCGGVNAPASPTSTATATSTSSSGTRRHVALFREYRHGQRAGLRRAHRRRQSVRRRQCGPR